jgi:hypothetical protein
MKKGLLFSFVLSALALTVNAQCTPYNFKSTITNLVVNGATATATLDVSFNIQANNGNKYIFVHLWTGQDYQSVAINWGSSSQKAPSALELNGSGDVHKALYNLAIDNNSASQAYLSSYVSSGVTLSPPVGSPLIYRLANGADSFIVRNISVTFPSSLLQATGDILSGVIWSSNAKTYSPSLSVQCYATGLSFLADPVISGTSSCSGYNVTITHNNLLANTTLTGTYDVYVDADGNGLFSSGSDVKVTNSPSFSITASTLSNSVYTGSENFSGVLPTAYKGKNLFVRVVTNSIPSVTLTQFIPTSQCTNTLPVVFSSFTTARNDQKVSLKWETSFEQNNKGYNIQRNTGNEWKDIAFVFSKADGGNSGNALSYEYNDFNNSKAVSYYRILQVDNDGKARYSEVRSVRGLEQADKLMLFPNPGTGGKINVLFENEPSAKDVLVVDATGRVVKSFKSVVMNNLIIDQLKPGIYTIQIKNLSSQTVSSDKFIIQN